MKFHSNALRLVIFAAFAACAVAPAPGDPAPRRDRSGGRVVRPGSQRGRIVVVNAQKRVGTALLDLAADNLRRKMGLDVRTVDGAAVDALTAAEAKGALGAEVAVFVVEDARLPASLVAREGRWGIVNLAAVGAGRIDAVRLFGRAKAELMRTAALVCGAGDSQFPGSLMSVGDAPSDLDLVDSELPIDVMNRMAASLARAGVTPAVYGTYRRACREGWAPAPTNDVQRAVWDEVRAIPSEPMKIEFDPKRGK